LVLFLTPLQSVHLFCNQSGCILLFFSCISSLLLLLCLLCLYITFLELVLVLSLFDWLPILTVAFLLPISSVD
jgi:hypothetical protein